MASASSAAAAGGDDQRNNNNWRGKRNIQTEMTASSSLKTLDNISKRGRKRIHPRAVCHFHDNTTSGYSWLLPGWIAEERVMEHGRVYRYYYDPEGKMYASQQDVLTTWEKSGLVVLDK